MRKYRFIMFLIIGIISFTALAYAAVPRLINYQGKFTDKEDNPLAGNYLVTFRFYDAASGGEDIWEEGHILTINNGMFNVLLGSIKPLEIDFNKDLWLGIEISNDGEMNPRIKLASSPYAINAQTIDMINADQLLRNDIDSVMSGDLTLKKDLILESGAARPGRIVFTDSQGMPSYLWMDSDGVLRMKKEAPVSDKDGKAILTRGADKASPGFIENATLLIMITALLIAGLILYSIKKNKS
jgi:hypothetical protein